MSINWAGAGCDAPPGMWITAADKKIKIKEMDSSHLYNCIHFIHERGGQLTEREEQKLDELEDEWFNRKESLDMNAELKIKALSLLKRRDVVEDELKKIATIVNPKKPWKCSLREDLGIVI